MKAVLLVLISVSVADDSKLSCGAAMTELTRSWAAVWVGDRGRAGTLKVQVSGTQFVVPVYRLGGDA